MTQNAKAYNDPSSVIYEDAERIRKLVFNFMKTNNPAYKEDPKYTSFPTPLPTEKARHGENGRPSEPAEDTDKKSTPGAAVKSSEQADRKPSVAPSATTGEADGDADEEGDAAIDFEGKSFQDAQQLIISHLLHYTDEEYVSDSETC